MGTKLAKAGSGNRGERGYALISVLIVMLLAGFIIVPLLNFASTGARAGQMYDNKSKELYAADAGVQNAIWQIKGRHLSSTFPAYSPYDFNTVWDYSLPSQVNSRDVAVNIQNIWVPLGISVPSESQASSIINDNRLIVTGSTSGASTYRIKITYAPLPGENLRVTKIGVWLPRGYDFVPGSSNLEDSVSDPYYAVPVESAHAGNKAWQWSFAAVDFSHFPGVNAGDPVLETNITFEYTAAQPGGKPDAVAWIATSGVSDLPFSWDADIQVYKINSTAGSTSIESYISKAEIRQMRSAMAGDYYAAGNSLMTDSNHDQSRETLLSSSFADVTETHVPEDAEVEAAYLYWSAWKADSAAVSVSPLTPDPCTSFNNWDKTSTSCWTVYSNHFRACHTAGWPETYKYLTLKNGLDLSAYASGLVKISWDQYISGTPGAGDGLDFAFSIDNGATWSNAMVAFRGNIGTSAVSFQYTIPAQYLSSRFKVRFYLVGMSAAGMYANIDNIKITAMTADNSIVFRIDGQQVYLDGSGAPQQGAQPLTASQTRILQNYSGTSPHGFSYACYRDVTSLVRSYSAKSPDPAINYPGHARYSVGDVSGSTNDQWSYAGWSLILIYSSSATQGHQLYLFDNFVYSNQDTTNGIDVDYDGDGQPGGTITGFIVPQPVAGEVNAAKITCFVGEGDECYSGDFLAFNAPESYRSHPMDIPNSYKLWDGTTSTPPGDAPNQPNNSTSPNNVWNSKSLGLSAAGVDVDTFYVTWASGLLNPGDTSARIDPYTRIDVWNLVYMIVSFRSETATRGALNYLIR